MLYDLNFFQLSYSLEVLFLTQNELATSFNFNFVKFEVTLRVTLATAQTTHGVGRERARPSQRPIAVPLLSGNI